MPKMKTKKSAAKRFRITGTGKVVHRGAHGQHYFKSKTKSRQMRLKGENEVRRGDAKSIKRLLGK